MNGSKLKILIVEGGITQEVLAQNLGISKQTLNAKLNNRGTFTVKEASLIAKILEVKNPSEIFFT